MRNQMKRLLTALRVGHWMRLAGPLIGACVLAAFLATNVGADTTPTTYYACVNMKNGSIYMVNAGDTCKSGYTPISWNQVGPQGPTGPTGPQGPQGLAGPTQTLTITEVTGETTDVVVGTTGISVAFCPGGTRLTGGGFNLPQLTISPDIVVSYSGPDPNYHDAWLVAMFNNGPANEYPVIAYALCASLT